MSNIAFNFLTESFLFNDSYVETFYSSIAEKELQIELKKYREHIKNNLHSIVIEIQQGKNPINTSIESWGHLPDENLLKQLALYLDRVVIPDPVFKYTIEERQIYNPMSQLMGLSASTDINRRNLATNIKYMKDTTLLVVNQFVKYFPVSLLHEPPKNIPLVYSENKFSDALPPEIFKLFYEKVKVSNVERINGYMSYREDKPLELGTTIHVGFDGDHDHYGMIYQYLSAEVKDLDNETGKISFHQSIPETISEKAFNAWVLQSINQAALKTYKEIFNELVAYTGTSGRRIRRHPDSKPALSGHLVNWLNCTVLV